MHQRQYVPPVPCYRGYVLCYELYPLQRLSESRLSTSFPLGRAVQIFQLRRLRDLVCAIIPVQLFA